MSVFSKLTPEHAEQVKNCKNKEELMELLKIFTELSVDELDAVSGGYGGAHIFSYNKMDYNNCRYHDRWTGNEDCYIDCSYRNECNNIVWSAGDPCKDVKPENVSSDFATGRITGADFFA